MRVQDLISKAGTRLAGALIALLCLLATHSTAAPPPQDNKSYRGDMDGDFSISLSDLNAARGRSLLRAVDYTAVVPGDLTKGDTADVTGDAIVDIADLNVIKAISLLKNYTTPDTPWSIDTTGIPASINLSGAIQVAVTNVSAIGRPGIIVRFTVASGPATLSGREYNPVDDGIRDHASPPGAIQVLAVTTTDFPGDQTGATELTIPNVGTSVELICTGDGVVTLNVDVLADTLKGIPALSANPTVNCSAGPQPACNDSVDNDGDGFIDYPSDQGCLDSADASEYGIGTLAGFYGTVGNVRGVYTAGNYAYMASGNSGLEIVDISDPSVPVLVGSYNTPGFSRGPVIVGNYAYLADAGPGGLQIIDISDPASPSFVGSYDTPNIAWDVALQGNYAYIADNTSGLQIIDVSVPGAPAFVGSYDTLGNARGVVVSGSYAYIADGDFGLQIIDVTDPASPALAGSYDTIGSAKDVYISGSYAYIADGSKGLQIIDITDPALPTLAGSYDTLGGGVGVFVAGNYALIADGTSGLQIIDVTNPASPVLAYSYYSWGNAQSAYVAGDYIYLADSASGMTIYFSDTLAAGVTQCNDLVDNDGDTVRDYSVIPDSSCSDLSDSTEGLYECGDGLDNDGDTFVDFPDDPGCTGVIDTDELGINDCDDGIDNDGDTFVDVADPSCLGDPGWLTEVSECQDGLDNDGDTFTDFPLDSGCTFAGDNSELGTNECNDGVDNDGDIVIDIADPGCFGDPSGPTETGECQDGIDNDGDTNTDFPDDSGCASITDILEIITECEDGIDNDGDTVTDFPLDQGCASLVDLSEFGTNECDDGADNDGDTFTDYPADPGCSDINDASELIFSGECNDGIDNDGDTWVDYPVDPGCINAVDTGEMGIPTLAGFYYFWLGYDLYVQGDYSYTVSQAEGLNIIDVSVPDSPVVEGNYETPGTPYGVFVSGNYAYIANSSGLLIMDISIPSSPSLIGSYNTPGVSTDVIVVGNYAYVADGYEGMHILDVTVPSSPVLLGTYDTFGYANTLVVEGMYAYVVDGSLGLQIIDVSVPTLPTFVGNYNMIGGAEDVFIKGNLAFMAGSLFGLKIIDISLPFTPTLIGSYNTVDSGDEVLVRGNYAFVANGLNGVLVFDVTDPTNPVLTDTYDIWGLATSVSVNGDYLYVVGRSGGGLTIINLETDPSGVTECNDFVDNDGDTFREYSVEPDPGCINLTDASEYGPYECDDGTDNDSDTLIDWPADPDCIDLTDNYESPVPGATHVWVDSMSPIEDGSIANPYKTIQAGLDAAVILGQNVEVALGTYIENVILQPGVDLRGGFDSSFMTHDVDLNRTAITSPDTVSDVIYGGSGTDVVIDGFDISGGRNGINIYLSSPTISNNYIHGIISCGIKLGGGNISPYIVDNTITDVSYIGLFARALNNNIYANIKYNTIDVYSAGGIGIVIYTSESDRNIATISNTFISGSTAIIISSYASDYGYGNETTSGINPLKNSIIRASNYAISFFVSSWHDNGRVTSYAVIENTTIAYNTNGIDAGVWRYGTNDLTIRNSIFDNNTNWHIEPSILATLDISYTNFWGPASCNCTPGPGVQFVDPLLNPGFTLQPISTLIDAGNPNASYNDAIPPGQGTVINDMGAFGGPGASGIIGTRTPFTP